MIGRIKDKFKKVFAPIARVFASSKVPPNFITLLGPIVAGVAAFMYFQGELLFAVLLLLLSGFVDALDGAVARVQGKVTPFGGVFDSICDRYSDAIVIFGVILGGWCSPFWGILALIGSLLVSYSRARAEAAGVSQLGVGIAERPERLIILMVMTIFQYLTSLGFIPAPLSFFEITLWLEYGIILIAVLAHITVVQRTVSAYRALARLTMEPK
ncbi:MAG: archaetidylinositol phosphate synthase [Promethearchaeota archaeon]